MKIALFCSSRNIIPPAKTGGTEQPIFYLAKGLVEKGHNVVLYAAKGSKVPGVQVRDISPFATCVKQKFLNIQERIASFYDLNALADFFNEEAESFDIIQFNSYVFHEIIPFTQLTKKPIIIRINYPHNLVYPYLKEKLQEIISRNKNIYFLPISNFIKIAMPDLKYLNPIYPAIDMDDFKFSSETGKYLLFNGRICHNKGVHLAIDVAKKVKMKLIISGRIDEEEPRNYYKNKVEPYIDNKNIKYVGEVGFAEKVSLYQGAYATLFPIQWDEPFGNVPIESMACGTPVITFNRAAMSESVKEGVSGFLVKNGDIEEMIEAVTKVPQLNRKDVRQWAESKFSVEKNVSRTECMYKSILSKKNI